MTRQPLGLSSAEERSRLLFIACLAFGLLLPAFSIGFLSDDFSWLNLVANTRALAGKDFLLLPSPYGYFRPLPMILFRIVGLQFPGAVWPFRSIILFCHLIICLAVFILGRKSGFPSDVCLLAAVIFAVFPCHAESVFWIASLNELLASLFVLSALLCLLGKPSWPSAAAATLLFTLALFSRESALCYLPLVLLLSLLKPHLRPTRLIPILLLPGLLFLSARLWWLWHLPAAAPVSSPGHLDLSPLGLAYRLLHYLTATLLPVKPFFDLMGFEHYEALRLLVMSSARAKYFLLSGMSLLALVGLGLLFLRLRIGPHFWLGPLFTLSTLAVYLPFSQTSEHFLYLPSIGMAYALACLLSAAAQRWRSAGLILILTILTIYLAGYGNRLYRWQQASRAVAGNLVHLESMLADVPPGGRVLVEGLNNRYFGIPFLGEHCLQDAWDLQFPQRRISFYFEPAGYDPFQIVYSPSRYRFYRRR